ncbi:MAG: C10 family peptidase [Bacteroidales bacterium]|nr:C10 family peptidase [Bacteroidales bacterium]
MKKFLLLAVAALGFVSLKANPVDVVFAKELGSKFVGADVSLAYTASTYRGENCFYVFNVGKEGFVIVSADDFYRPIIGYSENGNFDINNIPPALRDYLDGIVSARSINKVTSAAAPDVAADWNMLEKTGRLVSRHGGRGVDYLVQTTWDQSYPYNYFCPEDPDGSGGHTYVGCLATSMAQLVTFWKYPVHGNGSHCYYHEDYGQICADFENTYYDWDHMANKLSSSSPIEEIEAVATISFHCGVTIDMGYGPDGSGGASGPIPGAIHNYFGYSDACIQLRRDDFETETWKDMVREQFDMGWPMYYGGCDDGCHAFICDGYDDYDMFHFNLGWGGSSDGWYLIDDAPYTNPADAMFNFVPQVVYDATPSAPTNLSVTPLSDVSFDATVTWTNPTTLLDGSAITDIEKVVIMRNNKICHEITSGISVGETMSFTDHVPYYDNYEYKVYAVSGGRNGKQVMLKNVTFGPACDWKIVMTTTDYNGWKGNHISVYNMANTEVANLTMTSSASQAAHVDLPVGRLAFAWVASKDTIDNLSFNIYNSQNVRVFSFSGSSADLAEGVFFRANNGCGNSGTCEAPTILDGYTADNDIVLEWNGSLTDAYAFCVYRDDVIYQMVTENSEPYIDDDTDGLGHCYNVSVLCQNGESPLSNMMCVSVGNACNPARNIWYELQGNGKPIITWDAPENKEGLSGYFVFRKVNEDGEYERVKIVAPNKYEYKENKVMEYGNWYYYKVLAYYQDIECYSIPAKSRYGNEYYVKMYYSPENVDENPENIVSIYPNPAKDLLTIKAGNINQVSVYNSIGQKVFEKSLDADEIVINTSDFDSGIYLVKIAVNGNEVTRKISVIK